MEPFGEVVGDAGGGAHQWGLHDPGRHRPGRERSGGAGVVGQYRDDRVPVGVLDLVGSVRAVAYENPTDARYLLGQFGHAPCCGLELLDFWPGNHEHGVRSEHYRQVRVGQPAEVGDGVDGVGFSKPGCDGGAAGLEGSSNLTRSVGSDDRR